MAVLGEITELLKRWDVWRRVEAAPDQIDALEKRVAALERKLAVAPGDACPACGHLSFRAIKSEPMRPPFDKLGGRQITMRCEDCKYEDVITRTPK